MDCNFRGCSDLYYSNSLDLVPKNIKIVRELCKGYNLLQGTDASLDSATADLALSYSCSVFVHMYEWQGFVTSHPHLRMLICNEID